MLTDSYLEKKPFRFYARLHRRTFTLGLLALLATNTFENLSPWAMKFAIDSIQNKNQPHLQKAILIYLGLMAGWTLFRYFWRIFWGRFHQGAAQDLRNRIFTKLTILGPTFYNKSPIGHLMSLITNDVNAFRMAIGPGLLIAFDAASALCIILPSMILLSWSWTWKTLVLLPLVPPFMRKMEALIHERFTSEQEKLSDLSSNAQEIVSGIRVIKAYGQEAWQAQAFDLKSKDYEKACNRVAKLDAIFGPAMEFSVASGTALLLFFCTDPVLRGAISIGTFFAFQDYIRRMIWPMSAIGFSISMMEQGRASFARIRDLLLTETDIPNSGTQEISEFESLKVRNLSFTYAGSENPALSHVSFDIRAGETVGIVGPVGSGKSTLLQILVRLFPSTSGQALYNDQPIESFKLGELRKVATLVPQEPFLFSDSVSENIYFSESAAVAVEAEQIRHFAQVVNMETEIESLPAGYNSQLGERGVNLSGGQKQRLTIARALIRNSPLVILDDSLSAVDAKTEKLIVQQLQSALKKRTVLIVSHRLATLKHADKIIVLNKGHVEAIGSHGELLTANETYRHLNELQTAGDS
jgi:ATP-binding cassette subfamily B protein